MSRFYANIQGSRGEATRQGTKDSGMYGHIRGWNIGASVECFVDSKGEDHILICLTSGSNGRKKNKIIGEFTVKDLD